MKYCENCNVSLDDAYERCPLCHKDVGESIGELPYPKNPKIPRAFDAISKKGKIYIIAAIVACCVIALINAANWQGEAWSLIVIVPILYTLFVLGSIFTNWSKGVVIFINMLGISGFLLVMESFSNNGLWAQQYIIPFIIMSAIILYIVYFYRHRKKLRESFIYCIMTIVIGFIPLIINLLLARTVWWPSAACALTCAVTLIGIVFFAVRQFKNELEKRFHI